MYNPLDILGNEELECLDADDDCDGELEYRMALSETGRSYPRCDYHWEIRLDEQERYQEYMSDTAPDWFDPSYAGERWDDDY